jgi:cation transport regulator ChaB
MADININGIFMNYLLSALYRKVIVPNDFHTQAIAIREIMRNDVSGLVATLSNFMVQAASVDYEIKTKNDNLTKILKDWMHDINISYNGRLPSGINALAQEYFKERWSGATFPILKIMEWDDKNDAGILLPTRLAFVDGGSVYSLRVSVDQNYVDILGYQYFLGRKRDKQALLGTNSIITKPNGRWYDEYPVPYLIKNGVYYNFKIIQMLRDKQAQILDAVLPYLLNIQKNTDALMIQKGINYDDEKLKQVKGQFDELIQRMNDFQFDGQRKSKTPIRVTQHDEKIEHIFPDLMIILKEELLKSFEQNILAGFGFIRVADPLSSLRKETVLNPKAFIQEVKQGVEDFKGILRELVILIQAKNKSNIKYMGADFRVSSTPLNAFNTDEFKQTMRSLYDRGLVSKKLTTEVIGEVSYAEQLEERKDEATRGDDYFMFPPVVTNVEQVGLEYPDNPPQTPKGTTNAPPLKDGITTQDKISPVEKMNFRASILIDGLEGSPYQSIADLPDAVKKAIPHIKQRRLWLKTFNATYNFYQGKFGDAKKAETLAFKTAWSHSKNPHKPRV